MQIALLALLLVPEIVTLDYRRMLRAAVKFILYEVTISSSQQ